MALTDLSYHRIWLLSNLFVRSMRISVFCTNTFYSLCTIFHIAFTSFLWYSIARKGDTNEKVNKDSNIKFRWADR